MWVSSLCGWENTNKALLLIFKATVIKRKFNEIKIEVRMQLDVWDAIRMLENKRKKTYITFSKVNFASYIC